MLLAVSFQTVPARCGAIEGIQVAQLPSSDCMLWSGISEKLEAASSAAGLVRHSRILLPAVPSEVCASNSSQLATPALQKHIYSEIHTFWHPWRRSQSATESSCTTEDGGTLLRISRVLLHLLTL